MNHIKDQHVRRKICLAPLTVLELSPVEMVETAAEAGFDYVGIRLIPSTAEEPQHSIVGNTVMTKEIRDRSDDRGVPILDVETIRLLPGTNVAEDYSALLETAVALGASRVLVAGNDPVQTRLIDNCINLAALCATFGLTAELEFMPWTDVPDLQTAHDVLTAVNHPAVGLLVDTIHFDRSVSDVAQLREMPREWFHYMQLCDAPAVSPPTHEQMLHHARYDRLMPGEGELDLASIIGALPDGIPVSVEVPLAAQPPAPALERAHHALRTTKELLRSMQGSGNDEFGGAI